MAQSLMVVTPRKEISISKKAQHNDGSLILGTGLIMASMIFVPAIATRLGLGASLTGALRIALMKASSQIAYGTRDDSGAASSGFSCH